MDKYNSVSFSGGAFFIFYHIGIIKYLIENYKDKDFKGGIFGSSSGAFAAIIYLLIKFDIYSYDYLLTKLNNFLDDLKNKSYFSIPFMFDKNLEKFINENIYINDEITKLFYKKLYISVTNIENFKLDNEIINPISANQLIKMVIASSRIPLFVGNSKTRLDGFFSNNQPYFEKEKTLKINCIYSYNSDIYPKIWLNPLYIFKIPDQKRRDFLINLGYNDITNFINNEKKML